MINIFYDKIFKKLNIGMVLFFNVSIDVDWDINDFFIDLNLF